MRLWQPAKNIVMLPDGRHVAKTISKLADAEQLPLQKNTATPQLDTVADDFHSRPNPVKSKKDAQTGPE